MKSYVNDIVVTDPNGEKAILYPNTKQEAVEGLLEILAELGKADITTTTETTMPNSNDGRFLFKKIKGVGEQGENPSPANTQEIKSVEISEIKTHGNDKEATVTFISPIELRRIEVTANDDYTYEKDGKYYVADTIEKIDGEYKKVQRIGECVFDGTNNKAYGFTTLDNPYGISFSSNKNDIITNGQMPTSGFSDKFISSHFVGGIGGYVADTNKDLGNLIYSSINNIWFSLQKNIATANGITSVDTFNTWLQANNVIVHYILAEPIITPLSATDQIALNSLGTFDGITYLEFDSEIKPEFEGEYGTSKAGGYMLESLLTARNNDIRISSVEASVVNNI